MAATGMNANDLLLLDVVVDQLEDAKVMNTQRDAMTKLLWAEHLLKTLLRRMQG